MTSCAANDSALFGWDLTLHSVKNDIKTKEDMLAVIIHWSLVRAGFRCVGVGESMEPCESDSPTELLPEGWNFTENYALRYVFKGQLYNLALNKSGAGVIFVNIIHKGQNFALDVKLDELIRSLTGNFTQIMPSYKEFLCRVQTNLIDAMVNEKTTSGTQTPDTRSEARSLRQEYPGRDVPRPLPYMPPPPMAMPGWGMDPLADPTQVGRADLDPFGRGGGMLFSPPMNRPGVAQGSVPPGARFDPFRPDGVDPGPRPRHPPGADHLPPPGYDDMFM